MLKTLFVISNRNERIQYNAAANEQGWLASPNWNLIVAKIT